MIIVNPEFHRHIWLNFSPFRLITMPIVLALTIYLFSNYTEQIWQIAIFFPAVWTYFVVIFLWGNYEAASTSSKEIGLNTWDFQKMSSISPWELTIGKLFGATSYAWYSGIILLIIIAFSYNYIHGFPVFRDLYEVYPTAFKPIIYLIFSGVMGHAVALLLSIDSLRRKGKPGFGIPFIGGFLTSSFVLTVTMGFDFKSHTLSQTAEIYWSGMSFGTHQFVIASLIYFFVWTVIAIQRNLRHELQYKNSPAVLLVFLITLCAYFSGLLDNIPNNTVEYESKIITAKLMVCFAILMPCLYLTLFMEANNYPKYTRWIYSLKGKEWKRVFEQTPAWLGVFILLIPTYIGVNIGILNLPDLEQSPFGNQLSIFSLTTALLLFTARDGLIFHSILCGRIENHKSYVLILFYLLAYGLIPFTVFSAIDDKETYEQAILYFYPLGGASFHEGCLPVLVQVVLAYLIFRKSIQKSAK